MLDAHLRYFSFVRQTLVSDQQEHISTAMDDPVRGWHPRTFNGVVHAGDQRVLSDLVGPRAVATDPRGRSPEQSEQILTACQAPGACNTPQAPTAH